MIESKISFIYLIYCLQNRFGIKCQQLYIKHGKEMNFKFIYFRLLICFLFYINAAQEACSQDFWSLLENYPNNFYTTCALVDSQGSIYTGSWYNQYNSGGILRSDDEGNTWSPKNNGFVYPQHHPVLSLAMDNKGVIYAGAQNIIYKTYDRGENWVVAYQEFHWGINFSTTRCGYDSIILSGGELTNGVVRSGDNGVTWRPVLDVSHDDYLEAITDIQFGPNNIIYACSRIMVAPDTVPAKIYASYDFGNTWDVFYEESSGYLGCLNFDNKGRLLVGRANDIIRYDFDSLNWTSIFINYCSPNDIIVVPNDTIIVACAYYYPGNDGILISHDGGESYSFNNSGLSLTMNDAEYFCTDISGRIILVDNDQIYRTNATIFTGLSHFKDNKQQVSLYPNPFGDNLNIDLRNMKSAEKIEIALYSVDGSCLERFFTRGQSIENYHSANLVKGVYLLKISSESFNSSYKILHY